MPSDRLQLCSYVADGVSECGATLDDSVSEEEEGSFDELTDITPYLQPGVELSVLNEVRMRGEACHVAALTSSPRMCIEIMMQHASSCKHAL